MSILPDLTRPIVPADPNHRPDLLAGTPLGAALAEAGRTARQQGLAAERRRREEALAQLCQAIFPGELKAEHARAWPDADTLASHTTTFHKFSDWARREHGVGALPAQASTVALYLIELAAGGADLPMLRQTLRAIEFAHDVGQHYLDKLPIAAALAWLEIKSLEQPKDEQAKDEDTTQ